MTGPDLTTTEIQDFISGVKSLPGCADLNNEEAEKTALLYLRARKRDVTRAVELFKANKRMRYTENVDTIDPLEEGVRRELLSGKFTVLPSTDPEDQTGATLAIFTAQRHWPPLTTHRDTLKGVLYQLDVAMLNEQSQRNGLVVLYDMREAKYANFDYHLCIKLLNLFKDVYPARLRKVIIIDPPIWFRAPFGVLRLFVKEKMRDRISTVDVDEVYGHMLIRNVLDQLTLDRHLSWLRDCLQTTGHSSQLPSDYFTPNYPIYSNRSLHHSHSTYPSGPKLRSTLASHRYGSIRLRRKSSEFSCSPLDTLRLPSFDSTPSPNNDSNPSPPYSSNYSRRDSASLNRMLTSMYHTPTSSTQPYNGSFPHRRSSQRIVNVSGGGMYDLGQRSLRISKSIRIRNNHCILNASVRSPMSRFSSSSSSPAPPTGLNDHTGDQNITSSSSPTRLTVEEFIQRVDHLGVIGLCAEFAATFKDQPIQGTFNRFMLADNRRRNRYLDVPCLDDSAVQLCDGTYIHANWVHGYRIPRAYILAQGPLDNTRRDFWMTIWEHRVPVIVMLTKIVEGQRVKCAPYWPSRTTSISSNRSIESASIDKLSEYHENPVIKHSIPLTQTYGEFEVSNVGEVMEAEGLYHRTRLEVRKIGKALVDSITSDEPEVLTVDHLLYLGWPDFDIPTDSKAFLDFLTEVKRLHDTQCSSYIQRSTPKPPLLIHCSAGIGRTGTFVTVDICLQQGLREGFVDVPDVVGRLRRQRAGAVQVGKQYAFVHSALASALSSQTSAAPKTAPCA